MKIRSLAVGPLATNCHILTEGNQCIIIDPGADGESILAELRDRVHDGNPSSESSESRPFRLQVILLTHAHSDHTGAAGFLQERTGAPIYVGKGDIALLANPGWMRQFLPPGLWSPIDARALSEGDVVSFGQHALTVWETPGHSAGSLTFVTGLLDAPSAVFCGDLFFRGGVGRTDLPGGDRGRLSESLERVLRLPDATVVYPGHGAPTTVGREKREKATNPSL